MEATDMFKDLTVLWGWLKTYYSAHPQKMPLPSNLSGIPLEVLFYIFLMVAYDEPAFLEYLVQMYSGYLRLHFGEVEQKLVAMVHIEAGKLRDKKDLWVPNIPPRL